MNLFGWTSTAQAFWSPTSWRARRSHRRRRRRSSRIDASAHEYPLGTGTRAIRFRCLPLARHPNSHSTLFCGRVSSAALLARGRRPAVPQCKQQAALGRSTWLSTIRYARFLSPAATASFFIPTDSPSLRMQRASHSEIASSSRSYATTDRFPRQNCRCFCWPRSAPGSPASMPGRMTSLSLSSMCCRSLLKSGFPQRVQRPTLL